MFGYKIITTTPQTQEERDNSKKYASMLDIGLSLIVAIQLLEIFFDTKTIGELLTSMFINSSHPAMWGFPIAFALSFVLVTLFKETSYMFFVGLSQLFMSKKPQSIPILVLLVIIATATGYGVLVISAKGISSFSVQQFVKPIAKKDEGTAKLSFEQLADKKIKDAEAKYEADMKDLKTPINSAINGVNQSAAKAIAANPKSEATIKSAAAQKTEVLKAQLAQNAQALLAMKNHAIENARIDAKKELEKIESQNKTEELRFQTETDVVKSGGVTLANILLPVMLILTILVSVIGVKSGHVRQYELKPSFFKDGNGKIIVNTFNMIFLGLLGRLNNILAWIVKIVTPKEVKDEDAILTMVKNKSNGLKELARDSNRAMDRLEGKGKRDIEDLDEIDQQFYAQKKRFQE